ncbi:DUF934 domain-containing protein [Salibaculum halophilum]|uniref:DUF934 domain-containing protein n=1 Tax=Salibaculum halophilum TaxID=1914408 RepID=UPI000A0FAF1C|nr:DUF934 domain-containing protein [Salibaculum halophilum]
MSVIVTDTGFSCDDRTGGFVPLEDWPANDGTTGLDLAPDTDPARLADLLAAPAIRIAFPAFSDGRGFTLAARLRRLGYAGRLRAAGHVIADQYAMARRSGFDEVEIDADLAARQPEDQWLARADWRARNYQARLRAAAS